MPIDLLLVVARILHSWWQWINSICTAYSFLQLIFRDGYYGSYVPKNYWTSALCRHNFMLAFLLLSEIWANMSILKKLCKGSSFFACFFHISERNLVSSARSRAFHINEKVTKERDTAKKCEGDTQRLQLVRINVHVRIYILYIPWTHFLSVSELPSELRSKGVLSYTSLLLPHENIKI